MTNELKQLISIIRKSNNLPSDEKALSLAQVLILLPEYTFYESGGFLHGRLIDFTWDLTKDLDQQSSETLSQLLKLLNNEH